MGGCCCCCCCYSGRVGTGGRGQVPPILLLCFGEGRGLDAVRLTAVASRHLSRPHPPLPNASLRRRRHQLCGAPQRHLLARQHRPLQYLRAPAAVHAAGARPGVRGHQGAARWVWWVLLSFAGTPPHTHRNYGTLTDMSAFARFPAVALLLHLFLLLLPQVGSCPGWAWCGISSRLRPSATLGGAGPAGAPGSGAAACGGGGRCCCCGSARGSAVG